MKASSRSTPRGSHIKRTLQHDAGAYARCSYCLRYSDNYNAISKALFPCDCGEKHGWSGSFVAPGPDAKWSEAK